MNTFVTSDFDLCVVLIACDYELESIDPVEPALPDEYVIKRKKGLDKTIESYYLGELKIEPMKLLESRRIFEEKVRQAYHKAYYANPIFS